MKPENAIEVRDVTKKFKIYKDRGWMLKEMVLFANRRKYEEHEVLKGSALMSKRVRQSVS